nr:aromatic amino acid DMT transporter YddG [Acinetobacter sp. Marseille-Q1620]
MQNPSNKATLIGLSSIFIWASLVAVVKLITEALTPISGIALIYSFSAICILCLSGFPKIKQMPKKYLWGCGGLFVSYEILFLCSVALSKSHEQVMIIAMINYLWPPLTIVMSILAKQLNYRYSVILGFFISVFGLLLVVNPDILNLKKMHQVLSQNPVAYAFALIGAVVWPCYNVFTKKYAEGHNAVPLFFLIATLMLWIIHFISHETFIVPDFSLGLAIVLIGGLIGISYNNWNYSLQFGNIKLLILATYFIPIFSSLLSMMILGFQPEQGFWIGTCLVTLGALICWKSTWQVSHIRS